MGFYLHRTAKNRPKKEIGEKLGKQLDTEKAAGKPI
jgi:hypothetical protein